MTGLRRAIVAGLCTVWPVACSPRAADTANPSPDYGTSPALAQKLAFAAGGDKAIPLKIKRVVVKTMVGSSNERRDTETILDPGGGGLVRSRARDVGTEAWHTEESSLYGFLEISQSMHVERHVNVRTLLDLTVEAPLTTLFSGKVFSYGHGTRAEADGHEYTTSYQTTCTIGLAVSAATLHTKLNGNAIPLDCRASIDGKPVNHQQGYFLQDYGWHFSEKFETSFFSSVSQLLEVDLQ